MSIQKQLNGWTIYDHPLDYPSEFVARKWYVLAGETCTGLNEPVLKSFTLEGVRSQIQALAEKDGMGPRIRFPRAPQDDAKIIEVWL